MLVVRGFLVSVAVLSATAMVIMLAAGSGPASAERDCRPSLTASQFSPVVVAFDTGSIKVSDADAAKIRTAAQLAKDNYIQQICVTGFADKQGNARMNDLLSKRRADAVAAELRKHGISGDALVVSGRGEPGGEAFSGTQASSGADRRVEIRFAR